MGEDAVGDFVVVTAVALTIFGLFSSLISILVPDRLLLVSLKIFGVDVIFRDVGPVLRRAFFVYACGLMCISVYLLFGDGWDIYRTAVPNVIMGGHYRFPRDGDLPQFIRVGDSRKGEENRDSCSILRDSGVDLRRVCSNTAADARIR